MKTHRAGFTLIEILMVMIIAALILAFAVPKFGQMRESGKLSSAKTMMASTVSTARAAAIENGRPSKWKIIENRVEVSVSDAAGNFSQAIQPVYFDVAYNVSLAATFDSIVYDARGFATTPTGRIYIRGARVDSICVTALGAVMLRGCL